MTLDQLEELREVNNKLLSIDEKMRNAALNAIASGLEANINSIIQANKIDLEFAKENKLKIIGSLKKL